MDIVQTKQLISDLVKKCIGDRTLDEVSAATGLSRNRLHRLRNGDFTRIPSEDVFRALTSENANPQNGITYLDFVKIDNNHSKDDSFISKLNKAKDIEDKMDCIIWKWLSSMGDVTIYQKKDTTRFDLIASVDNKKYYFEYKIVFANQVSSIFLNRISTEVYASIATSPIEKEGIIVIVTNNVQLSSIISNASLNISSKIKLMLLDLEENRIVDFLDMN